MMLRKTILFLTVITLILSLVLAGRKQQGNTRMDRLVGDLTEMRDKYPSRFDSFLRNQHRYFLETESQRQRLRSIYQDIQQSPNPVQLEKKMEQYYDWLQSMLQYQRMSHLSQPIDERLEQIRNSLNESSEEAFPIPWGSGGRGRGPMDFVDDSLRNIPPELFMTFYKNRLEQFFQEYYKSLPEDEKANIENQKNTFCSLFGESPESPGIWTLTALLKLHHSGVVPSMNPPMNNIVMETVLQGDSPASFRTMLTNNAQVAFDKLEPDRKRSFVRFGIFANLFQQGQNNDFFKKLWSNRFSDAQEKLLREIFEFLPDHEMEQIVKSPPEHFNREVVFYFLLSDNYRDRMMGIRGMPGGSGPSGGFGRGPGGPGGRPPGERGGGPGRPPDPSPSL